MGYRNVQFEFHLIGERIWWGVPWWNQRMRISLRILTGKKQRSNAFEKYECGHLCGWHMKSTLHKKFLKLKQNFQLNKVVTGKNPFFVIGPFYTPHFICLNIGFWKSSFVWKCKRVRFFQKICFKISSDCHMPISQTESYFKNP